MYLQLGPASHRAFAPSARLSIVLAPSQKQAKSYSFQRFVLEQLHEQELSGPGLWRHMLHLAVHWLIMHRL